MHLHSGSRSTALVLGLLVWGGCRCQPIVTQIPREPLRVSALELIFPDTFVGASRTLSLEVLNPTVVSQTEALTFAPPFEGAAELVVPAGSSIPVVVTFRPTLAGAASAVLRVGSVEVTLRGVALAPLPCEAVETCHAASFDAQAGTCSDERLSDGVDCTASRACFVSAECRGGQCVGTLTTCDDGDRCTIDACGAAGCVHVAGIYECPQSTNPCEVPSCDSLLGCAFAPAPDGTECGLRDCQVARVCIAGSCVQRPAPQTQACAQVVFGRPMSQGSVEGVGHAARLYGESRIEADPSGTVWVVELGKHLVRKVTPAGRVSLIAGDHVERGIADGFGLSARFDSIVDVTSDRAGNIYVAEPSRIRKMSPAGLVTTFAGQWRNPNPLDFAFPVDGAGTAAVFAGIKRLSAGADGALVVLDGSDSDVSIRKVSALGEVTTHFRDRTAIRWYVGDVASLDAGVVFSGERFYGTEDGGLGQDSGVWLVLSDGGLTRTGPFLSSLAADQGRLLEGTSPLAEFEQWSSDAGLMVRDVTAAAGAVYVLTSNSRSAHLFRIVGGTASLIAGPELPEPFADGPISTAGTSGQLLSLCVDGDAIRFAEAWPQGSVLMRTLVNAAVTSTPVPGAATYDLSGIACPGDGTLWGTTQAGVSHFTLGDAGWESTWSGGARVRPVPSGLSLEQSDVIFTDSYTLKRVSPGDGGVIVMAQLSAPRALALGIGGVWVADSNTIRFIDDAGTVTIVAGAPFEQADIDGPGALARFGWSLSLAREASGNLVVSDSQNRSIRSVTPAGEVSTIMRLADPPSAVVVEDGGALLVIEGGAIIRVRR